MPNKTIGTLISDGMIRKSVISEYLDNPKPIKAGEELITPEPDEKFVRLFHYQNTKIENRNEHKGKQSSIYIVSNKGYIISFENPDSPKVLKKTPVNREKGEMSYLRSGDNWLLHKAVWFSFAADAIINNTQLPTYYRIHESFWTLEGLLELAELGTPEFGRRVMVHHKDLRPKNNNLDNLELLPNNEDDEVSEKWHSWMHDLKVATDVERFRMIVKNRNISVPTMIQLDERTEISEIDQKAFEKQYKKMTEDARWSLLINVIIAGIIRHVDSDFFSEKRYGFIEKNETSKSIVVSKKPDNYTGSYKENIINEVTQSTEDDYVIDNVSQREEYDFIYIDGKYYFPKMRGVVE